MKPHRLLNTCLGALGTGSELFGAGRTRSFAFDFIGSTSVRFFMLVGLIAVPLASPAAETLETVEKSASEWMKLRVETARLETAWQEERTLVQTMAAALKERALAAEEKRDLAKVRTAKDREEFAALQAKNDRERSDLLAFDVRLKSLAARLVALRPALPPRLSEALEMSFRSLGNPDLPSGERMEITINALNRCAQFNRSITVGEDVLALDGASPPKSLEVIYWGLSHGYAVDRVARKAWLGASRDGTWRWEPSPLAFESVVRLIAIAGDKADPDFVVVPATVPRLLSENSPR